MIERVAVLGCGEFGSELALSCLRAGMQVTAIKLMPGDLEATRDRLLGAWETARATGELAPGSTERAPALLTVTRDLEAIAGAQLVLEAAAERVEVKHNVLSEAEAFASATAVLASTTGSLRPSELSEALRSAKRFVALHFLLRPLSASRLVEIGTSALTSEDTLSLVRAFCARLGKTPLVVGDLPGYILNRLLISQVLHAIELLESGAASVDAIDSAMQLGGLLPAGPLALADELGLDAVASLARNLYTEHADARFVCPALLRQLVRRGALGVKTGAGFYLYSGAEPRPNPEASPLHAVSLVPSATAA